jgi:hypothetical protein
VQGGADGLVDLGQRDGSDGVPQTEATMTTATQPINVPMPISH